MPDGRLHCTVVTPESSLFDGEAERVTVPAHDGEVGILPGHARLLARIGNGELRILDAGKTTCFYVEGGFLQVAEDRVTVLTDAAFVPEEIDVIQAEDRLESLRSQGLGEEFAEARRQLLARRRVKERLPKRP